MQVVQGVCKGGCVQGRQGEEERNQIYGNEILSFIGFIDVFGFTTRTGIDLGLYCCVWIYHF